MKYLADTIVGRVWQEVEDQSGTFRYVLPAYPSNVLLRVGTELADRAKKHMCNKIEFRYGIAFQLGKIWDEFGTPDDQKNLSVARTLGWYNESDNLTSLRNSMRDESTDCLLVLLAGHEHIHDKESLRDFYRLDQESIWQSVLKRSFVHWVEKALADHVNRDDNITEFEEISEFLTAIYDLGLSDLVAMSSFLEDLDKQFRQISVGRDAYRIILENLDPYFGLPKLNGVLGGTSRRGVKRYITSAQEFFHYTMFLEARDRKKALDTINDYQERLHREERQDDGWDRLDLGAYESQDELCDALKDYIENGTKESIPKLKTVDFTIILDKILGHKDKGGVRLRKSAKTVRGVVPVVFLNAIWDALARFAQEQKRSRTLGLESLKRIRLVGVSFRHDFESIGEDDETLEARQRARAFLTTLLGGVDTFLQERLFSREPEKGSESMEVLCQLLPADDEKLTYKRSMNAEPQFQFRVILENVDGASFHQDYIWPLPANHQSRLVVSLYEWLNRQYEQSGDVLPVFSAPFVAELAMAKDEEEATRLLELCLASKDTALINLLNVAEHLERKEKNLIASLSYAYRQFAWSCLNEGMFEALNKHYQELRSAYRDLLSEYLSRARESSLGPLLYKAFLLLPQAETRPVALWNEHLPGAVVTPLHPALLDMILHQGIYLCESFSELVVRSLKHPSSRSFSVRNFDRMVDLSKIQRPLYGLLSDAHKNLDTNIKSLGYVHMLGSLTEDVSILGAKLFLEDDLVDEDDEIDDAGLFRETRTSQLICRTLSDYRDLYSFAKDGISVAAYCGGEIQPLIAGLDEYIQLVASESGRSYSLQLTIFSDGLNDRSILRWVEAWKDRWQLAELTEAKSHYQNCQISVRYRVVERSDGFEQFRKIIQQDEYDVFFFMDFIRSSASRFQPLESLDLPDDYQKFPIVEKVSARLLGGGKGSQRERVLSNPRFKLNALHAEVMATMVQPNPSGRHVIVSVSDFSSWAETLEKAHKHSSWVVCIDPSVDEQLLRSGDSGRYTRDVIAFGTGVGSHGEKNFTISTNQFSMEDIEQKVAAVISSDLGLTDHKTAKTIAASLVREAVNVAGLSIVKATGGDRFARELIANALVRKVLKKDLNAFCDELISLDAFVHWFDEGNGARRPDLLRIRADIVNGYFDISLQLIECKLAMQSDGYLERAREQIENGLRELVGKLRPRISFSPDDYGRTDQRYWWMQLHRLISTHGSTTKAGYAETLMALERLSEGLFTVRWHAGVFAVWTDMQARDLSWDATWQFQLDNHVFPIVVGTTGLGFVQKASLEAIDERIFASVVPVVFQKPDQPYNEMRVSHEGQGYTDDLEGLDGQDKEQQSCTEEEANTVRGLPVKPEITGVDTHGFARVFLGPGTAGGPDAYWEFGHPDLPNRHILVFGASGTGKTYLIQALMCELARLGLNTLVFDYTSGFTNNQLEPIVRDALQPKQHFVKVRPLEVNPFRKQVNFIDDMYVEEDPATIAGRVSGVFDEVYQLGDQQRAALYTAIRNGVTAKGALFTLRDLMDELETIREEGGPSASSAASVISKIQPFVDTNPFGSERPESWEHLFTDPKSRVHIIQLAGFMKNAARLITEFSLIDLYWYYRSHGDQRNPKIIVLDEIQNLSHKLESPLGQFLTEGRKFGISLVLATQTLSNLDKEERDRLFQASHKIFFRPADTEIKAFAQILADSTGRKAEDWVEKLSTLKRGECYSLGPAYNEHTRMLEVNKFFRIRVRALEERL